MGLMLTFGAVAIYEIYLKFGPKVNLDKNVAQKCYPGKFYRDSGA